MVRTPLFCLGLAVLVVGLSVVGCGGGGAGGGGGVGSTFSGSLGASSPKMEDGSAYQAVSFVGRSAGTAQISVSSSTFDPLLTIEQVNADGTMTVVADADSGSSGTTSRASFSCTAGTMYRAIVTFSGATGSGAFSGTYSSEVARQ